MPYAFLTDADVLSRIRDEHRQDLTDATESIELTAESMAMAKMKSYLNGRYDTEALFPAPVAPPDPDPRNPLIVLHCLNIFVYLLYRRINPRKIPEEVKLDHEETLEWLADVAKGSISPDFPPVASPEVSALVPRVGGGQPIKGHYF
mgnify:CR=1 FL=1